MQSFALYGTATRPELQLSLAEPHSKRKSPVDPFAPNHWKGEELSTCFFSRVRTKAFKNLNLTGTGRPQHSSKKCGGYMFGWESPPSPEWGVRKVSQQA